MSPKELMYIDDSLGHLEFVEALCKSLEKDVKDTKMKEVVECAKQKCEKHFQKLLKIVEGEQ